jgi:hypothetical protein
MYSTSLKLRDHRSDSERERRPPGTTFEILELVAICKQAMEVQPVGIDDVGDTE